MTFQEKMFLFFTIALLLLVLVLIVFSKNGVLDYTRLAKEKAAVLQEKEQIKNRNQSLEQEIRRLKHDLDYLRHVARHDLKMTAEDDVIFKVMDHGIQETGRDDDN